MRVNNLVCSCWATSFERESGFAEFTFQGRAGPAHAEQARQAKTAVARRTAAVAKMAAACPIAMASVMCIIARVLFWRRNCLATFVASVLFWRRNRLATFVASVSFWRRNRFATFVASVLFWRRNGLVTFVASVLFWRRNSLVTFVAFVFFLASQRFGDISRACLVCKMWRHAERDFFLSQLVLDMLEISLGVT